VVCGSLAAEMAIGKGLDELLEISGESILDILGRFPEEERHWAFLTAETLQEALHDYIGKKDKKSLKKLTVRKYAGL
ncbi:MAG: iron-sulfur cluster assembly scaffold protein, partial [Pseudomonadota bacterium]